MACERAYRIRQRSKHRGIKPSEAAGLKIFAEIERMRGRAVLIDLQGMQVGQHLAHGIAALEMTAMAAPGRNHQTRLRRQPLQRRIIPGTNGSRLPLHRLRVSVPPGEEIGHAERAKAPAARIVHTSPHRRVHLGCIRRGRIQANEHAYIAFTPAIVPLIPIATAWGEGGGVGRAICHAGLFIEFLRNAMTSHSAC